MGFDFHTIVIGAGSGGLVVASATANLGLKVALIEGDKMGGDCLNYGCVPSKTFLKSAHLAADIQKSSQFGLNASLGEVNFEDVMKNVHSVIKEIEPHDSKERFQGLGVDVFEGYGMLVDKHHVKVGDEILSTKFIVIATGSEPNIPDLPGFDTVPFITNKTFFDMTECPKRTIVLGGGPIGLELGQGLAHLGSDVTIIDHNETLFKHDDAEVWPVMKGVFERDGMLLKCGYDIKGISQEGLVKQVTIEKDGKVELVEGDEIIVSLGRKPNIGSLNLDEVKVACDEKGGIIINQRCQSSITTIFACGDVCGPFNFTHMAGYQAGIIIRNTIFKFPAKCDYSKVPWATYTKPEVAHVGYIEGLAKEKGLFNHKIMIELDKMDRAKTDHDRDGFLKLILNKKNRVIGATLVGEKAGEMISVATLAIHKKVKVTDFLSIIFPYPTESEIYKFAGLDLIKTSFKPWMKKVLSKVI